MCRPQSTQTAGGFLLSLKYLPFTGIKRSFNISPCGIRGRLGYCRNVSLFWLYFSCFYIANSLTTLYEEFDGIIRGVWRQNAKVRLFSHTAQFRLSIRADFQHRLHDFGPYVINGADSCNFRARFITDTRGARHEPYWVQHATFPKMHRGTLSITFIYYIYYNIYNI